MTLVVKDLKIYGETDILQLDGVRELVWKAKEDILRKSVSLYSPDELILIEPVGEIVFYEQLLRIVNLIKDLPFVKIYTSYDVFDMLFLPENIEVMDIKDLTERYEFSSSPLNNRPKIIIDTDVQEIEVSPIWVVDVIPTDDDPVKTVEEFLSGVDSGIVVAVIRAPLKRDEKETLEVMLKEYNGVIVTVAEDAEDPSSEVESEFYRMMDRRMGKYLGIKLLRGEEM